MFAKVALSLSSLALIGATSANLPELKNFTVPLVMMVSWALGDSRTREARRARRVKIRIHGLLEKRLTKARRQAANSL